LVGEGIHHNFNPYLFSFGAPTTPVKSCKASDVSPKGITKGDGKIKGNKIGEEE